MVNTCDVKRAGQAEFRCYFQLAMQIIGGKWKPKVEYSLTDMGQTFIPVLNGMFEWGKTYASFLVSKETGACDYTPGTVFDNIDEMVSDPASASV